MRVHFTLFKKQDNFLVNFFGRSCERGGGLRPSIEWRIGRVLKVLALRHVDYRVYIIGIHHTLHLTVYSHSMHQQDPPDYKFEVFLSHFKFFQKIYSYCLIFNTMSYSVVITGTKYYLWIDQWSITSCVFFVCLFVYFIKILYKNG